MTAALAAVPAESADLVAVASAQSVSSSPESTEEDAQLLLQSGSTAPAHIRHADLRSVHYSG